MSFQLVRKSVTFNDLERRNGRCFALFHRLRVRCRRETITSVLNPILIVYDHINTTCAIIQRLGHIWAKQTLTTRFDGRRCIGD